MIKIAGREDSKAHIFKLVHDWLRECEGKWLLILDNVDTFDLLSKTGDVSQAESRTDMNDESQQLLSTYLSQSSNGSILIINRSQVVTLKLVEEKNIIAVESMTETQTLTLCEKKLKAMSQDDHVVELAHALKFMPLIIVQATAYLFRRASRFSVQRYLKDFRKSDRNKTSLLNVEGGQLRRD